MQENKEERIMKQIKLEINIEACHYDELTEKDRKLIDAACEATKRSYAPYSHFAVGAAALLENDIVITGTNQENAAYPSGLCAERTTLFYANSQYPDQAVKTLLPIWSLCRTYHFVLCQFSISGSSSKNTRHCCPHRKWFS